MSRKNWVPTGAGGGGLSIYIFKPFIKTLFSPGVSGGDDAFGPRLTFLFHFFNKFFLKWCNFCVMLKARRRRFFRWLFANSTKPRILSVPHAPNLTTLALGSFSLVHLYAKYTVRVEQAERYVKFARLADDQAEY